MRFILALIIAVFFSAVFAASTIKVSTGVKTIVKTPQSNINLETNIDGAGSETKQDSGPDASATQTTVVTVNGGN